MNKFLLFPLLFLFFFTGEVEGEVPTINQVPKLLSQPVVTVKNDKDSLRISFGPLSVETGASNTIKHIISSPREMMVTGFQAHVSDSNGQPLKKGILHHISFLNLNKPSSFCSGAPYLLGGSGMDMSPGHFPKGYGLALEKNSRLMVLGTFYHHTVSAQNIRVTLKLDIAEDSAQIKPMEAYHISVTADCYNELESPLTGETEEGFSLPKGVFSKSKKITFPFEGCVRHAYPHVHDYISLLTLDNLSNNTTVLRTMPEVDEMGKLQGFQSNKIFSNPHGFPVSSNEEYELSMTYHRPLHSPDPAYAMGTYLLYWTPLPC